MLTSWRSIGKSVRDKWPLLLLTGIGFTLIYYAILLLLMMIKFGQLPNYFTLYDWPENVMRIIESTPSIVDMLMIIKAEWLVEVGYMNYEFGMGIAEWSLFVSPAKALATLLLGATLALLLITVRSAQVCASTKRSSTIAGGIGAAFVSISLMSLSWVVCCATPTWIVGLAILGLGVSTSIWLEPAGIYLNLVGFSILFAAVLMTGRSRDNAAAI